MLNGLTGGARVSGFPDTCPLCNRSVDAKPLSAYQTSDKIFASVIVACFQCPSSLCRGVFLASYLEMGRGDDYYVLKRCYFREFVDYPKFPETISSISKPFVETYTQALIAEENRLDQVCGTGYRRALEFLVKDYLVYLALDESSKVSIREKTLSKCIDTLTDVNIKATAKRAAWLGNDETHYTRIWEDKDVQNLKDLIQLTVNWIDSSERTRKYKEEMP